MIVRKKFRVESAHIVRNCTSHRCSHSMHGHSAVIELFLTADKLDNAGMVYDFGLLKGPVKDFIDSMDHAYLLCDKDSEEFREFVKSNCARWIEMPFNPSAECLSMFIHAYVNDILACTQKNNGEGNIRVVAVRYHETETGYAESSIDDLNTLWNPAWSACKFSDGVVKEWGDELKAIFNGRIVANPVIEQQIDLTTPTNTEDMSNNEELKEEA